MDINRSHQLAVITDLGHLRHNLNVIREKSPGKKIMGIVKKNAYGHGMVEVAQALVKFGVDYLGVIFPEEGFKLREAGIKIPILILGATLPEELVDCISHNLELSLLSLEHLEAIEIAANQAGKKALIHLKIDTGMGRIGIRWDDCQKLIQKVYQSEQVKVQSIFSHLACADLPENEFTNVQVSRLEKVLEIVKEISGENLLVHLAASGGILHYPQSHFDMIRPGHLLYGLLPDTGFKSELDLKPVLSLQTRVIFSKRIKSGDTVGYGKKWIAEKDCNISTIALGYGDGYSRKLTAKGVKVIVNGKYYPIVGSITMDQTMINTGDDELVSGTEVVLIGKQGSKEIHVHELADLLETCPDDITSGINWTIPRNFKEGEESNA